MPRIAGASVPKYRKHRSSGQAVCTINGKDHYLGPYGTKASKIEYDRLIGEWLAAGRPRCGATVVVDCIVGATGYRTSKSSGSKIESLSSSRSSVSGFDS